MAVQHVRCECGRQAKGVAGLRHHQRECHWQEGRFFACPEATCARFFSEAGARQRHQRDKQHCYCGECALGLDGAAALDAHFSAVAHAKRFYCADCRDCVRYFDTPNALRQGDDNYGGGGSAGDGADDRLGRDSGQTNDAATGTEDGSVNVTAPDTALDTRQARPGTAKDEASPADADSAFGDWEMLARPTDDCLYPP